MVYWSIQYCLESNVTFSERFVDLFRTACGRYANTEPIVTGLHVIDGLHELEQVIVEVERIEAGEVSG